VGDTIADAVANLYETAQLLVFYGHVNAIVYSENIFQHDIEKVFDIQSRFPELRYTLHLYGTKEPIDQIMNAKSFFNMSSLQTVLHRPWDSFLQHSRIPP